MLPSAEEARYQQAQRPASNLFGCLPSASGLKNAFVLVQISRFQQIIGVYTLQAPTETAKVGTDRLTVRTDSPTN